MAPPPASLDDAEPGSVRERVLEGVECVSTCHVELERLLAASVLDQDVHTIGTRSPSSQT